MSAPREIHFLHFCRCLDVPRPCAQAPTIGSVRKSAQSINRETALNEDQIDQIEGNEPHRGRPAHEETGRRHREHGGVSQPGRPRKQVARPEIEEPRNPGVDGRIRRRQSRRRTADRGRRFGQCAATDQQYASAAAGAPADLQHASTIHQHHDQRRASDRRSEVRRRTRRPAPAHGQQEHCRYPEPQPTTEEHLADQTQTDANRRRPAGGRSPAVVEQPAGRDERGDAGADHSARDLRAVDRLRYCATIGAGVHAPCDGRSDRLRDRGQLRKRRARIDAETTADTDSRSHAATAGPGLAHQDCGGERSRSSNCRLMDKECGSICPHSCAFAHRFLRVESVCKNDVGGTKAGACSGCSGARVVRGNTRKRILSIIGNSVIIGV